MPMVKSLPLGRSALGVGAACLLFVLAGCDNMGDQPKAERNERTALLPRETAAQPLPPGTVPREGPWARPSYFRGVSAEGAWLQAVPEPVTEASLADGARLFDIYCAVCHGPDGYGDGIVPRRGFPSPPSYHTPRLRGAPVGYLYDVVSRGYGAMAPYAERLTPQQRWQVVAYVRALQWSQHPEGASFDSLAEPPSEEGAAP